MQNRFNIFVDDHSVPLDIFLHLHNYRTQEICKIIPINLVLAASDLCPRTLFISVPEYDIGHGEHRWTCIAHFDMVVMFRTEISFYISN